MLVDADSWFCIDAAYCAKTTIIGIHAQISKIWLEYARVWPKPYKRALDLRHNAIIYYVYGHLLGMKQDRVQTFYCD